MSLRRYAQIAAVVFVVLGLAGFVFASVNYSGFFGPGVPENLMHLLVGLGFGYLGFWPWDAAAARTIAGGMGALLLVGKGMLIAGNLWGGQNPFSSVTEVVCVVVGIASILAAMYLPDDDHRRRIG